MGEAKRRKQLDPNFGKTFWRFMLPKGNEVDFAGDAVLAEVQLSYRGLVWDGWATYADDTLDGFSITFASVPRNEFEIFFKAKNRVREDMGRQLEQILADAGFSPQPRPSVKRTGNIAADFKMSAFNDPSNSLPPLRTTQPKW